MTLLGISQHGMAKRLTREKVERFLNVGHQAMNSSSLGMGLFNGPQQSHPYLGGKLGWSIAMNPSWKLVIQAFCGPERSPRPCIQSAGQSPDDSHLDGMVQHVSPMNTPGHLPVVAARQRTRADKNPVAHPEAEPSDRRGRRRQAP